MSDALLDPQEMEAIQAAIRQTAPRRAAAAPAEPEPTRLALLADDRLAEAARPVLIELATRAARAAARTLRPHIADGWHLDVIGAEIVDGAAVKDELRGGWIAGLAGPDAELVIAAHGGVIDLATARRCGAVHRPPPGDPDAPAAPARPPSAVALRLFQPAGRGVLDTWSTAWRELSSSEVAPSSDLGIVSRVLAARSVVRAVLAFSGAVTGRISAYARPEVLVQRPAQLAAFKATTRRIAAALGNVPVELVAELGTLRLRLRELRRLERGATFTLQGFVDSRVPIYCGGVLKAWGRPVVCRGVLAVQIDSVVHGQGAKS